MPRLLHTMLRVRDLDASLDFYCQHFGMKLLRKQDFPGGEFTLAFVGYGDESETAVLELTHNWGDNEYNLGDAYGHIAIGVDDAYAFCDNLKKNGVEVVRDPGPMKHGTTVIAFAKDPDGYMVELIQP